VPACCAGFDVLKHGASAEIAQSTALTALIVGCKLHSDAVLALQAFDWARGVGLLQGTPVAKQVVVVDALLDAVAFDSARAVSLQLLEAAYSSYVTSFEQMAPFVHFRFGRALLLGITRAGHASAALSLLRTARQHGELLAPSSKQEKALVNLLVDSGRLDAAVPVLTAFRAQRAAPEWPGRAWPKRDAPLSERSEARLTQPVVPPDAFDDESSELSARLRVVFGATANAMHTYGAEPRKGAPSHVHESARTVLLHLRGAEPSRWRDRRSHASGGALLYRR